MNQNSNNDSNEINNENHNHHHHHHHNHQTEKNKDSKDLEKLLYLLTGKIDQKTYFDYLHSLFYSLHQKLFIINKKKKKIKFKNDYDNEYDNDFGISKRRSSPSIIKVKNNLLTNHLNISNKFKRSNSNISNTDIIHLIKCKEK